MHWCFTDPPETPALTLQTILGGAPVLYVEHDENGGWHCLDSRALFTGSELALVPISRLVQADPSLNELGDLPKGWRALRRSVNRPWERESTKTRETTRARTAALLEEMRQDSLAPPPGSPSTTELLREDRER